MGKHKHKNGQKAEKLRTDIVDAPVKPEIKPKSAKAAKPAKASKATVVAAPVPDVPAGPTPSPIGTYADGTPFDQVQYLEAKLILKPDRFTSTKAFRAFGKLVAKVAKATGVGYEHDPKAPERPEIREITFYDTPDFRLYNNAFILRRRIAYEDGFAYGDHEIVCKFRHPDEAIATAVDMRPKIEGNYDIKFKAEVLPLKEGVGGYRLLYSHNCRFGMSQWHSADRVTADTLSKVFPALTALKLPTKARVGLVNGGIVEEVMLPLGILDFGGGRTAKTDISLWRTRGEHKALCGEFSFQVQFDTKASVAEAQKKKVAQFYVSLQLAVEDWLALGVTKTGMVYQLNGNPPASHE
jgi:hypothetical protein